MPIKAFFLLFFMLVSLSSSYSQQIVFENKSEITLLLSVATYESEGLHEDTDNVPSTSEAGNWTTRGWYYIYPGNKLTIDDCIEKNTQWSSKYVGYCLKNNSTSPVIIAKYDGFDCPNQSKIIRGGDGYELIASKLMAVQENDDFMIHRADDQPVGTSYYRSFYIFKGLQNFKVVFEY